jgi:hypothetical protein
MEAVLKCNNVLCYSKKALWLRFTVNEEKAYQAIDYGVLKQSTVLAYMDIFYTLNLILLCIPIVFLSKEVKMTQLTPCTDVINKHAIFK